MDIAICNLSLGCDVDCDATPSKDGAIWRVTDTDGEPTFGHKSLIGWILSIIGSFWSIFGATTTNQEVAGSSPAGRTTFPEKIPSLLNQPAA
jgi:hypothetical protein